jgi:hypothetical protein
MLSELNFGRPESHFQPAEIRKERMDFQWNCFFAINNTYKNVRRLSGTKKKLDARVKQLMPMRIMQGKFGTSKLATVGVLNSLDAHIKEGLVTSMAQFDARSFIANLFPFQHDAIEWQVGKRAQLEVFARVLRQLVMDDKIVIHSMK